MISSPNLLHSSVDTFRLFKRGEPWAICQAALANGSEDTRKLAYELMKAKGMDTADTVLAKGLTNRLISSPPTQEGRGRALPGWQRHGVIVWKLPPNATVL